MAQWAVTLGGLWLQGWSGGTVGCCTGGTVAARLHGQVAQWAVALGGLWLHGQVAQWAVALGGLWWAAYSQT